MLISFFGPNGKGQLDLKHFQDFCIALHAELVRLEFLHYDDAKKVWPTLLSQRFVLSGGACVSCPGNFLDRK